MPEIKARSKEEVLFRNFAINRSAIDEEKRTIELSFSSEDECDRGYMIEVLSHDTKAVRLKRLKSGGPLLVMHDREKQVGVVEKVEIGADRKGRAVVRFGKSAFAEEIFGDVLDGIRTGISVGYYVHSMELVKEEKNCPPVYRATDWEPIEISIEPTPADIGVGVGRTINKVVEGEKTMGDETKEEKKEERVDVKVIESQARSAELSRVREILAIGDKHGQRELANAYVEQGKSLDEFRAAVLEKTYKAKPVALNETADIGMSKKEAGQFSIVRAINAIVNGNWKNAQFELEASRAVAEKSGKEARGFYVPSDVLKRDLTVGTPADGGYLVATDLRSSDFITLLRNKMVVKEMGATILSGLTGNVAIPKQTGGASAYWVTEGNAPTESQAAFGQLGLTPKTVGAFSELSRKLLLQGSIDIENFVRNDLATVLALELDRVAIAGSGVGAQPKGILNTTGIGDVAGGATGAAPTFANMVALETLVAVANADIGRVGYLTNAKVRGTLKTTEKATGTAQFIWTDSQPGIGMVNGYSARASNNVPFDLTKSTGTNLSAIIFGNFADLIIATWGALDIQVNPYSLDTTGAVRITALMDADIGVRRAASFAAMQDAIA